jgi:cobalt/nickel transport system ATP-binding protein
MQPSPIINIQGLRYSYPDGTAALDGVDFQLHDGETVALFGANGSGKTTFVLHLNGLLSGEGRIEVCGMEMNKTNLAAIRRKVGMVFQDSDEQLFMPSVLEDVAFGPMNKGVPAAQAIEQARVALQLAGMAHASGKAPYHLSAGEKRRVALAGVLVMNPSVLVLDEPTTFLDPPGQRELVLLLKSLPQGKIVVTHDISFARALATRAIFFCDGRIGGEGGVDEIIERFNWSGD